MSTSSSRKGEHPESPELHHKALQKKVSLVKYQVRWVRVTKNQTITFHQAQGQVTASSLTRCAFSGGPLIQMQRRPVGPFQPETPFSEPLYGIIDAAVTWAGSCADFFGFLSPDLVKRKYNSIFSMSRASFSMLDYSGRTSPVLRATKRCR